MLDKIQMTQIQMDLQRGYKCNGNSFVTTQIEYYTLAIIT